MGSERSWQEWKWWMFCTRLQCLWSCDAFFWWAAGKTELPVKEDVGLWLHLPNCCLRLNKVSVSMTPRGNTEVDTDGPVSCQSYNRTVREGNDGCPCSQSLQWQLLRQDPPWWLFPRHLGTGVQMLDNAIPQISNCQWVNSFFLKFILYSLYLFASIFHL